MPKPNIVPLRLPQELCNRIAASAKNQNRCFTEEVIYALKQRYEPQTRPISWVEFSGSEYTLYDDGGLTVV